MRACTGWLAAAEVGQERVMLASGLRCMRQFPPVRRPLQLELLPSNHGDLKTEQRIEGEREKRNKNMPYVGPKRAESAKTKL